MSNSAPTLQANNNLLFSLTVYFTQKILLLDTHSNSFPLDVPQTN